MKTKHPFTVSNCKSETKTILYHLEIFRFLPLLGVKLIREPNHALVKRSYSVNMPYKCDIMSDVGFHVLTPLRVRSVSSLGYKPVQ